MNIYIGNISYSANEHDIKEAFGRYGDVSKITIIKDRETGMPKGFGFIEMPNDHEGQVAVSQLNGLELKGRPLKVNEARPREKVNESHPRENKKKFKVLSREKYN